jgi:predicted RNase H-like HicB family nuclease
LIEELSPVLFDTMLVPLSKIQVRRDEDGVWIAKSRLLPGCHAHGKDRGEAVLRFQEAAKAHLEALLETGRPIPPAFRDKFVWPPDCGEISVVELPATGTPAQGDWV